MPKGKTEVATPSGRSLRNIRKTFKLGGRGNPKSAIHLSTTDLMDALTASSTRGRDLQKIRQVLANRKVEVA